MFFNTICLKHYWRYQSKDPFDLQATLYNTSTAFYYTGAQSLSNTSISIKPNHSKMKRIRSRTDFIFSPFLSYKGTDRIPGLNSDTGKHVCPPKSSLSDISYSLTSILSNASSGTVSGKLNSSSQIGYQLSSITLDFLFALSAGTPTMNTYRSSQIRFLRSSKNV